MDITLVKMQKYRRNWVGLWSKCRNTEEIGQDFGQNAGIQKKLDRTSTENELRQIVESNLELQTEGQMKTVETVGQNCRCVRLERVIRWTTAC